MKNSKRTILTVAGICTFLTICFVGLCFLLPDLLGSSEPGGSSDPSGPIPWEPISEAALATPTPDNDMINHTLEAKDDNSALSSPEGGADISAPTVAPSENVNATQVPTAAPTDTPVATAAPAATAAPTVAPTATPVATAAPTVAPTATPAATAAPTSGTAAAGGQDGSLKDQYAPVFLAFTANPQIKVGNEFNVHKYIGYGDDVDRDVEMEVSGAVDTSKEGDYPITITLKDDAGRTTSKSMTVKVVKSTSSGSSGGSGKKEDFADFVKNYKTEETSLGIDISRWQEDVDFEKVKAAGCEFVYMRLGGFDEGEHYTDRYYLKNMAGAKAAGLKVGIYWHSEERNPQEVKASIDYLMKVLNGETLDFPIAFDWEDFMNFERYGMNLHDINQVYRSFVAEIEARGYSACMYGSKNRLETLWEIQPEESVWLAHYTKATSYGGKYFMWQHSCTGKIDGIKGDVDLDVLYHSQH